MQSFQSFKKLPRSYFFGAKSKSAVQLEKYDDRSDRSHSLSHVHMIAGIESDPIPAI